MLTKTHIRRIRKSIRFWKGLPDDQLNQSVASIPAGATKPCGCFGAHMNRLFRIHAIAMKNADNEVLWYWNFAHFFQVMEGFLGITNDDLMKYCEVLPYGCFRWGKHPFEVLKAVLKEKLAEQS